MLHETQSRVSKYLPSEYIDGSVSPGGGRQIQVPPLVVIHCLPDDFTARVLKILSPKTQSRLESLKALKNELYLLKA